MQELVIEGFRLSPQQKRLWTAQEGSRAYCCQASVEIEGKLDRHLLRKALQTVVSENEVLRTTYRQLPGMEVPLQVISEDPAVSLDEIEIDGARERRLERVAEIAEQERGNGFDLTPGPVINFKLITMGEASWVVVASVSSMNCDGWALKGLMKQMCLSYQAHLNREQPSEPLVQYVQVSEWQNELLETEEGKAGIEYWKNEGEKSGARLRLPLEREEAQAQGGCTDRHAVELDRDAWLKIKEATDRYEQTVEVFMMACWHSLIWRLTGQEEIVVKALLPGRTIDPLEEAIGLFAKYLPIRSDFKSDSTFTKILGQINRSMRNASARQNYYVDEGLEESEGSRLSGVGYDYIQWHARLDTSDFSSALLDLYFCTEPFKLRLSVCDLHDRAILMLYFDRHIFSPQAADWLMRYLLEFTGGLLRSETEVSSITILPDSVHDLVVRQWNDTSSDRAELPLFLQMFHHQVDLNPHAPAVSFLGQTISYAQLDARANQLAHALLGSEAGPETVVALCLERGIEMIVGILGIIKSGGVYLPIDPYSPRQRISYILQDAAAKLVVTQRSLKWLVAGSAAAIVSIDEDAEHIGGLPQHRPPVEVEAENLIYIIYTSGSTGKPKGVMVRQSAAANLVRALRHNVYEGAGERLRVSLNAQVSFDGSIKQLLQLADGHCLCVIPKDVRTDAEQMVSYITQEQVEVLDCTPSQMKALIEAELTLDGGLKMALVGGEEIGERMWEMLAQSGRTSYYNVYGPTECTVDAAAGRIERGMSPAIGRPISNVRVHILDERLRAVGPGMVGEICIAGEGLARGYLNSAELTAEKFVPNPYGLEEGERVYRTGDLGRYEEDGRIQYVGRADRQVKLRGYRVELDEIEEVLREHARVKEAVVGAAGEGAEDKRLVAYVVPDRKYASKVGGKEKRALPNGLTVAEQNANETRYLYEEIFEKQTYMRRGIRLSQGGVVFDVGANIGMFAMFVSLHWPNAKVFTFEPIKEIAETLKLNMELYGGEAKVFEHGLSNEERENEYVYYRGYSMMSGDARYADATAEVEVIRTYLHNEQEAGRGTRRELMDEAEEILGGRFAGERKRVKVRRLSDVIREQGVERIELLKVDVQRAEMEVLEGIEEQDWEKIDQIVMEAHDKEGEQTQGRVEKIKRLLRGKGYSVVAEQDELMIGTDRYNLYASRIEDVERVTESKLVEVRRIEQQRVTGQELMMHVKDMLPDYMVPRTYVFLESLPLSANGKIDYKRLPEPEEEGERWQEEMTPYEEIVRGIWEEVLGKEVRSRDDNFFDKGGHSLMATQVMSRVRKAFEVEMPLRSLFESGSLKELSARIEEAKRREEGVEWKAIERRERGVKVPMSFAQQRLWFLDKLEPGNTFYNCGGMVKVRGELNVDVLERAIVEIVRRHEVLRTRFREEDGVPVQEIMEEADIKVERIDISGEEKGEQDRRITREAEKEWGWAFDLSGGKLLRAKLLRLSPDEHVALMTMHHIVSDGWSMAVLTKEVAALYDAFSRGSASPLPDLPIQYADYAQWQRESMSGQVLDNQLSYWRKQLGGEVRPLELRTDRPRPAAPSYRGSVEASELSAELSQRVREMSRREGATQFMVMLAGFKALMRKYTGQEEVAVGTAIANRNRAEVEGLIGFFINTLVLKSEVRGSESYRELLRRVKEECLGAYAHQDLPFEKLVEELQPERRLGRSPLFQVMFSLHNVPQEPVQMSGLTFELMDVKTSSVKFDLGLSLYESAGGMICAVAYRSELFDELTIKRMLRHYRMVLEKIVEDVEVEILDIPLLTEDERYELTVERNSYRLDYPRDRCLYEWFEDQVLKTPDATALVFGDEKLSYLELNRRANQLARYLKKLNVGPEVIVGIFTEYSTELIVGLLGILKAGGAYIGLDPELPSERLAFILKDTGATVIITREHLARRLPDHNARLVRLDAELEEIARQSTSDLQEKAALDDLAYIIYTSGSTGTPKGVAGAHKQLLHYLNGILPVLGVAPGASYTMHQSLAVDAPITHLFAALCTGGSLHLLPQEMVADSDSLERYFKTHEIDYFKAAPSHLAALQTSSCSESIMPRRLLMVGGEALRWEHVEELQSLGSDCVIVNHYGPTETTVGVLTYSIDQPVVERGAITVPLGKPLANTEIYILDERLNPVPPGVPGELYVGGEGLARGYLNRPGLTAEKFVPNQFGREPGSRLYRTGDRAAYLPDGNIEFIGRKDHQVKVRGFRIELGEIEAVLGQHPAIQSAVAIVRQESPGDDRIVAYVATKQGQAVTIRELRGHIQERLPHYMMPSSIILMDAFPRTPQGKIDRQALPAPHKLRPEIEELVQPRTATEERLALLWAEVLGVEDVGIHDNFFELGGHSLLATQLVSRVRKSFGIEMPLRSLFETPTVAGIAQLLESKGKDSLEKQAPAITPVLREGHRASRASLGRKR